MQCCIRQNQGLIRGKLYLILTFYYFIILSSIRENLTDRNLCSYIHIIIYSKIRHAQIGVVSMLMFS